MGIEKLIVEANMEFKREFRYFVAKHSDIKKHLTQAEQQVLNTLLNKAERGRIHDKKPMLRCVVIESDWPEYESVWNMIEQRVIKETEECEFKSL